MSVSNRQLYEHHNNGNCLTSVPAPLQDIWPIIHQIKSIQRISNNFCNSPGQNKQKDTRIVLNLFKITDSLHHLTSSDFKQIIMYRQLMKIVFNYTSLTEWVTGQVIMTREATCIAVIDVDDGTRPVVKKYCRLKVCLHTVINRADFVSWCMLYMCTKVPKCICEKMTTCFHG